MEILTSPTLKKSDIGEDVPTQFPEDQLLQALYWAWDGFDRVLMKMMPIYKTAEDILQNIYLSGDRVSVGVRKPEWVSGSVNIIRNFLGEPLEKTETYEKYANPHNKVPVYIYILEDDPCLQGTNKIFYASEYFELPTPYSQFIKVFGARP